MQKKSDFSLKPDFSLSDRLGQFCAKVSQAVDKKRQMISFRHRL